jgi:RHS repeat-associated protein
MGNSITHTYDAMDRLATRTDQVGRQEFYEYDQSGNLIQATDRKAQVTTFTYDALDRRTNASYGDGTTTSFIFDAVGRLIQATDSVGGTIVNTHDILDRLVSETTPPGTVSYQYDSLGRRTRMDVTGQVPVTYSYDTASRLRQVIQGSQTVDITYDALGRRTRLTLPNSVSTEYSYDAASRLTALVYRNASTLLGDLTYQYDAAGNRTAVGGSFARTLLPDPFLSATYDPANRQITFGDKAMTYDANGNLTSINDSSGITTFTWDARNRLLGLNGPSATGTFIYDAVGRRSEKVVNGQRSQFQYETVNIIAELRDGSPVNYLRGLSVDEVFSATDETGTHYVSADTLGSILNLTDTNGVTQSTYHYGPFGQVQQSGQVSANPFQFTGRENDRTGLHYYRFRYYNPILSRFISEDPLRPLVGTDLNLYAYVSNSPLNAVDPFGLYEEDVHRDLTYFLARKSGFPNLAAQRIAASNQGTDDNAATSPFASTEARRDWHFTTPERRAELWQRALDGNLDRLGQYLHVLQDSYSHEGYPAWRGHLFSGHEPDKTYNDPQKANRMARDTYNRLREYLQRTTGQAVPDHWERIRDQVDRFNRARTAHEKKKILGR